MTCDEAVRAIEAMLDREIDDDERMQLEAHLAGCESCRRETEERRAFSDRVGRDLNDAFPPSSNAAPRVIIRPRRFPWVRAAAVILVGFGMGYVGAASGFFRPATAEAHEVANLSALKDAYENRDRELAVKLDQEATALDRRAAMAPDGAVRDAATLCVMRAASGLAGAEAPQLPQDPAVRARWVARELSGKSLARRGLAVQELCRMSPADVAHVEGQLAKLDGTNRTFTELWVLSAKTPAEPAVTLDIDGGALRFVQLRNARIRVEASGAATPKVYEGMNVIDFRVRFPEIARQLSLKGTDGHFTVAGVLHRAPGVESRPAAFVPAVVWGGGGNEAGGMVEALSVYAVMADCARAGGSVDEAERRGRDVMRRVHEASKAAWIVRADPERVQRYLVDYRRFDAARLALERERLNDDVAALERRVGEQEQRLDCVYKAAVTLDYKPR